MVLRAWWMIFVWIAIAVFCWRYYKSHNKDVKAKKPVANSHYLQSLESYKSALKQYKLFVRLITFCLALVFVILIILSVRPASKTTEVPEFNNRDIMLCLDVSGSMTNTDSKIVETFSKLAKGFKGERIGMVIFDSSAATIFPLTDDYEYVTDILDKTYKSFTDEKYSKDNFDIFTGVNEGEGSSLIGDGLASCVLRFDNLGAKRSRSIILATDNYANGSQIVDLKQAGALAKKNDIRIYGLNPSDYSSEYYKDQNSEEFREVVLLSEGDYYKYENVNAVAGIIDKVSKQEATRFKGASVAVVSDKPQLLIILSIVLISVLMVAFWRLGI